MFTFLSSTSEECVMGQEDGTRNHLSVAFHLDCHQRNGFFLADEYWASVRNKLMRYEYLALKSSDIK